MITIDQLLESVDLDFEPRWVTKDETGVITFHSYETEPRKLDGFWGVKDGFYEFDKRLKLAEFENKPWTECIYEVPRKTTGKIERFTPIDFDNVNNANGLRVSVLTASAFNKLNELVEAVNELKGAKNE